LIDSQRVAAGWAAVGNGLVNSKPHDKLLSSHEVIKQSRAVDLSFKDVFMLPTKLTGE